MPFADIGDSFQRTTDELFEWLPRLLGALLILLIGYLIARFVARIVRRALRSAGADRALEQGRAAAYKEQFAASLQPSDVIGTLAFWFVFGSAILLAVSHAGHRRAGERGRQRRGVPAERHRGHPDPARGRGRRRGGRGRWPRDSPAAPCSAGIVADRRADAHHHDRAVRRARPPQDRRADDVDDLLLVLGAVALELRVGVRPRRTRRRGADAGERVRVRPAGDTTAPADAAAARDQAADDAHALQAKARRAARPAVRPQTGPRGHDPRNHPHPPAGGLLDAGLQHQRRPPREIAGPDVYDQSGDKIGTVAESSTATRPAAPRWIASEPGSSA